jgi:hypothetical protein
MNEKFSRYAMNAITPALFFIPITLIVIASPDQRLERILWSAVGSIIGVAWGWLKSRWQIIDMGTHLIQIVICLEDVPSPRRRVNWQNEGF